MALIHHWTIDDRNGNTLTDVVGDLNVVASDIATFVAREDSDAILLPANAGNLDLGVAVNCNSLALKFQRTDQVLDTVLINNLDKVFFFAGSDTAANSEVADGEFLYWNGSSFLHTDSQFTLNDLSEHALAFVFDSATNDLHIYIDGQLLGTVEDFGAFTVRCFGYLVDDSDFFGAILLKDIRIYDTALTQTEIAALAGLTPSSGILAVYSFEQYPGPQTQLLALYSICRPVRSVVAPYAIVDQISQTVQGLYSLAATQISASRAGPYSLAAPDRVTTAVTGIFSMFEPPEHLALTVTATVDGQAIHPKSVTVSADEDSFLTITLDLPDVADWMRCEPNSMLFVTINGQAFTTLIDSRSRSREFGMVTYTVDASNPVSRLNAPYSDALSDSWSNTSAKTIAQELCDAAGITLVWNILDYPVKIYNADNLAPVAVIQALATEGGRLVSRADGALVVQYLYPVSPTKYDAATPDLTLTSHADIIAVEEQYISSVGYNAVYVLDGTSTSDNLVELQDWTGTADEPEILPDGIKILAVFTHPFQAITPITSCGANIYSEGVVGFDFEETVEVSDGAASLTYPAANVLSYCYNSSCKNLGPVKAAGKRLVSFVSGNSVLIIAYRVFYQRFRVETAEKNILIEAKYSDELIDAGQLLRVTRGLGDRLAPEVIEDALCTTPGIATQRGRNYLDEIGYNKITYDVTTTCDQELPEPGALCEVHDASLGESFRAKVNGWELSISIEDMELKAATSWTLERSLTA